MLMMLNEGPITFYNAFISVLFNWTHSPVLLFSFKLIKPFEMVNILVWDFGWLVLGTSA